MISLMVIIPVPAIPFYVWFVNYSALILISILTVLQSCTNIKIRGSMSYILNQMKVILNQFQKEKTESVKPQKLIRIGSYSHNIYD